MFFSGQVWQVCWNAVNESSLVPSVKSDKVSAQVLQGLMMERLCVSQGVGLLHLCLPLLMEEISSALLPQP